MTAPFTQCEDPFHRMSCCPLLVVIRKHQQLQTRGAYPSAVIQLHVHTGHIKSFVSGYKVSSIIEAVSKSQSFSDSHIR